MNREKVFFGIAIVSVVIFAVAAGVALGLAIDDQPAESIDDGEIERLETEILELEAENSELKGRSHTKSPIITITDCYEPAMQWRCVVNVNYPLYRYKVMTNHGSIRPSISDDSEYVISGTSDGSQLFIQSETGDTYVYTIHIDDSGAYLTEGDSDE